MARVQVETVCTAAEGEGAFVFDLTDKQTSDLLLAFEDARKRAFCVHSKGERVFLNLSQVVSIIVAAPSKAGG